MSTTEEPTVPQWVCEHCFIHLVNGDCSQPEDCHPPQCWPLHPEVSHPLAHLSNHATPGMLASEHSCGRENGEDVPECDCETDTHSTSQCNGCHSWLHGTRYAVTDWIKVTA